MSEEIPAYQAQVVEEKALLDASIVSLEEFVGSSDDFLALPPNEQFLIRAELDYKKSLAAIMSQRISFIALPSPA